jgi:hypothetical protein
MALVFAAHSAARAQDDSTHAITISVGGAYEQSAFDDHLDAADPCGCLKTNGVTTLNGKFTGLAFRAEIAYRLLPSLEIGARADLSEPTGIYTFDANIGPVVQPGGTVVPGTVRYEERFPMGLNRFDLLLRHHISETGIAIGYGATIGWRKFGDVTITENLVDPPGAEFIDSHSRKRTFYDGSLQSSRGTLFGLLAEASMTIPIVDHLALVPQVMLRGDFTARFDTAGSFSPLYASAGLSLAYTIPTSPMRPDAPPPEHADAEHAAPFPRGREKSTGRTSPHPLQALLGLGYEQNLLEHGFAFPIAPVSGFGRTQQGTARGYDIRAGMLYGLLPSLDIGVRAERALLRKEFTHQLPSVAVIIDSSKIPVNAAIVEGWSFTMETLRFDLFGRYELPLRGLALELGATIANRKFDTMRITQSLVAPTNARFINPDGLPSLDSGRTLVAYEGYWSASHHLLFGAEAGLSYTIPLGSRLALAPEVTIRKEFTPPRLGSPWPSYFLSAGLSASYAIASAPEEPMPAPPEHSELARPKEESSVENESRRSFRASIDLYSVDAAGNRMPSALVSSGTIAYTHHLAAPRALYFDAGSAMIPERYLARGGGIDHHPSLDSLARLAPDEAYYHLLDIAAERLRTNGSATLTLHAGHAAGVPGSLPRERAESVRRYMSERWRIDPARVKIAEDGSDAAVVLETSDGDDISGGWSERYFHSTPVKVDPAIDAEAGVKSWKISFMQNDRVIAEQSSNGEASGDLDLAIAHGGRADDPLPMPITAVLAAEDSAGATTRASSTLTFERDTRAPNGDSVVMIHDLLGDAAHAESKAIAGVADDVAASHAMMLHITISPIFITHGEDRRDALRAIAARLRDELRGRGVKLSADRVSTSAEGAIERDERNLPEDAMLNDGVRIVISGRTM